MAQLQDFTKEEIIEIMQQGNKATQTMADNGALLGMAGVFLVLTAIIMVVFLIVFIKKVLPNEDIKTIMAKHEDNTKSQITTAFQGVN